MKNNIAFITVLTLCIRLFTLEQNTMTSEQSSAMSATITPPTLMLDLLANVAETQPKFTQQQMLQAARSAVSAALRQTAISAQAIQMAKEVATPEVRQAAIILQKTAMTQAMRALQAVQQVDTAAAGAIHPARSLAAPAAAPAAIMPAHLVAAEAPQDTEGTTKWLYSCALCPTIKTNDHSTYLAHIKKHKTAQGYTCTNCTYSAALFKDLAKHMLATHQGLKSHRCAHQGCSFMGKTLSQLSAHQKKAHFGNTLYICPLCNHTETTSMLLKRHIRITHPI